MLERQKVENDFAHLYREHGLGLAAFSLLRQGILTGKYKDGIPPDSRFAQTKVEFVAGYWKRTRKEQWDEQIKKVNRLEPIAQKLEIKQSVLALAWVLANPNVSSAITGARSPQQVYENIEAVAAYKKLTPEILAEIEEVLNNKPPAIVQRF